MSEPIYQWSGFFLDSDGNKDQFVYRIYEAIPPEEYMEQLSGFKAQIAANGYSPVSVGVSSPNGAQEVAQQLGGEVTAEIESIEVESIVLAAGGEHPRWVVKGGWAKQYGITCWPEVLEDAGILDKLNPTEENKPSEKWIAFYSKKPKKDDPSKMTADKVIRLERQ